MEKKRFCLKNMFNVDENVTCKKCNYYIDASGSFEPSECTYSNIKNKKENRDDFGRGFNGLRERDY